MRAVIEGALGSQFARYVINGLVATAVHFSVLTFNLKVLGLSSAGIANGVAALFGITVSFVGSRYFVFDASAGRVLRQGSLFLLIYMSIAVLHAMVLFGWTDWMGWDYRIGFLLATAMQMTISFFANKFVVFR